MPERTMNNFSGQSNHGFKDSVCIDCNKIMDSCRDKDCQCLIFKDSKLFVNQNWCPIVF